MPRRKITATNGDDERLRDVMRVLERIRAQRKQRWGWRHPAGKRFTLEAMEELVPAYHNARFRPEKTLLLSRDELLKLCDYLECTSQERNDVLLTARYEPVSFELPDEELNRLIETALEVMRYLPFPAYLMTRNWDVCGWNRSMQVTLGWDDIRVRQLRLAGRLNVLHLLFDREWGLRDRIRAPDGSWEDVAIRNVYLFKVMNIHCRYDEWYQSLENDLRRYDDFDCIWQQTDVSLGDRMSFADYVIELDIASTTPVRFRPCRLTYSSPDYPLIVVWVPVDEASSRPLRLLDIPIPSPSDVDRASER